jgi:hypothetical protein
VGNFGSMGTTCVVEHLHHWDISKRRPRGKKGGWRSALFARTHNYPRKLLLDSYGVRPVTMSKYAVSALAFASIANAASLGDVKHVIMVMFENRSFNHVRGVYDQQCRPSYQ